MKLFARACLAASIALIPVACGGDDENKSKATCGNNEIEGEEVCDGTDLGGMDCAGATMDTSSTGSLACTTECDFDVSGCSTGGTGGTGGSTGGSGGSTGGSGGSTGGAGGSTGGMGGMMGPGGTMGMPDGGDAGGMGGGGMGGTDAGGAGGSDMDGSVDMDSSTSTPDAAADSGDGG